MAKSGKFTAVQAYVASNGGCEGDDEVAWRKVDGPSSSIRDIVLIQVVFGLFSRG